VSDGESIQDEGPMRFEPRALETAITEFVTPGANVLLLGSLAPAILRLCRDRGCKIVALAIDRTSASRARRFTDHVIAADVQHLEDIDGLIHDRFGVILVGETLGRLGDPTSVARWLRRLLRRDGCVVAVFSNISHVSVRLAMLSSHGMSQGWTSSAPRLYSLESLEDMFQKAGFEIRHVRRYASPDPEYVETANGQIVPPAVLRYLRQDPEARTHRFVVAAYRLPRADTVALRRRIRELERENESAQREIDTVRRTAEVIDALDQRVRNLVAESAATRQDAAELRDTTKLQAAEIQSHVNRIALMSHRESELRRLFLEAQDQLVRRDQELQASVAALREPADLPEPRARTVTSQSSGSPIAYGELLPRIRAIVDATLPEDATVIVVSKGDDELLRLNGRKAWHFPRAESGVYAGHYPLDSAAAIAHLEVLREAGGNFVLFPRTAFWWLDHYGDLRRHLEVGYRHVPHADDACMIFDLRRSSQAITNGHRTEHVGPWLAFKLRILRRGGAK
jgi:cell division protein FtsB